MDGMTGCVWQLCVVLWWWSIINNKLAAKCHKIRSANDKGEGDPLVVLGATFLLFFNLKVKTAS